MDNCNVLSEPECVWYLRHLGESLEIYSQLPSKSYAHVCAASALLGFIKDVLPNSPFNWQIGYQKVMEDNVPELCTDPRAVHATQEKLEREIAESGYCFKSDVRD